MKKVIIKVLSLICAVFMLFSSLLIPVFGEVLAPFINPMKDTYVVNDLKTMGFNPANYPKDPSADIVQLIHFLEYGYDANGNFNYYNLYLYLYNPSGRAIEKEGSYVELAYYDPVEQRMSDIVKYPLTVESRSIDYDDENVFYKLKVGGVRSFVGKLNDLSRQYQLSAVEIKYEDSDEIINLALRDPETGNCTKYTYTGYQQNFGSDKPDGSLWYRVDQYETVDVEVIPLTWYSDTSNLGEDYRWEVKSYAFNIPISFIKKYGDLHNKDPENEKYGTSGLWSVSGEYYKYAVNGLIVPDQTWYDRFKTSVNTYTFPEVLNEDWATFYKVNHAGIINNSTAPIPYYLDFSFNMKLNEEYSRLDGMTLQPRIYYSDNAYSKYCLLSQGSSAYLSKDEFEALWILQGKPYFANTSNIAMIRDHVYDLGKVDYDISVDGADLSSALITHAQGVNDAGTSSFNKWLDKLFNKGLYTDEDGYVDCKPLVQVNYNDLSDKKVEEYVGTEYYIDYDSYLDLKDFSQKYTENGNRLYIIRTGVEPYYQGEVTLQQSPATFSAFDDNSTGYYYEKVIHTDFDILSFTFRNQYGEKMTVPVNAKPVDNLGGVVNGNNQDDNNPNNYPETPGGVGIGSILNTGKEILDLIAKFLAWLEQFKTTFILIVAGVGTVAIVALVCIFWKWLEPVFRRIGEVLGPVVKGFGKVFGVFGKVIVFLLKLICYPLIFLWNVAVMIASIWFPPAQVLKIPMKLNIGGDSSDARYYYEDRKYKQSEERRKQEKHEKEMGRLKPENPDAELIKRVKDLNKADEAAKEKRREDREKANE